MEAEQLSSESSVDQVRIIPPPPDFPVRWEVPGDAELLWSPDRLHFPRPVTPMLGVVYRRAMEGGQNRAAEAYDLPVRFRIRRINSYIHLAITPVDASADQLRELGRQSEENLRAVMPGLRNTWETEFLPEIRSQVARWDGFDLAGVGTSELLVHLNESVALLVRFYEIHFLNWFPFVAAVSMFQDCNAELFGGDEPLAAFRMLEGFENRTLEADSALWKLSRKARENPKVRQILEETPAVQVPEALRHCADGRGFATKLHNYLKKYGYRTEVFMGLGDPYWIEDPVPAIRNIKQFLLQNGREELVNLRDIAVEREHAIGGAECRLKGFESSAAGNFEFLMNAAQEAAVLQEENNYWIDEFGMFQIRRIILEFGRRFAEAGVIESAEDVFYLEKTELKNAAAKLPDGEDLRKLVAERKLEMERFAKVNPPAQIGKLPLVPLPDMTIGRVFERFFGAAPKEQSARGVLHGSPASPGKTTGPARIVRTLADAEDLKPGDVLVIPSSTSAWSPLFATASAVVAEFGGVLGHSAFTSRLYRVPAVVGVPGALASIPAGARVEVDGQAGTVTIL
jgi:phosphohistidine swiveling domain-containing protein